MNFATDRDLLAIEPAVFQDVPLLAQQRLKVTDASLDGTTLVSPSADFIAAGVDAGSVLLLGSTPIEVLERTDEATLTVSLLRDRLTDAAIPPVAPGIGEDLTVTARTFAPQTALVHATLLTLLGVRCDPDDPDALSEDAVVSLSAMARLEALGTLERVYTAAQSLTGDNTAVRFKAEHYQRRFAEARRWTTVLIDTNGDGHADERRSLGLTTLTRV